MTKKENAETFQNEVKQKQKVKLTKRLKISTSRSLTRFLQHQVFFLFCFVFLYRIKFIQDIGRGVDGLEIKAEREREREREREHEVEAGHEHVEGEWGGDRRERRGRG
jgi:hypothetical protein